MERDHAVTATIARIMELMSRSDESSARRAKHHAEPALELVASEGASRRSTGELAALKPGPALAGSARSWRRSISGA
jgi:hypothetical protein